MDLVAVSAALRIPLSPPTATSEPLASTTRLPAPLPEPRAALPRPRCSPENGLADALAELNAAVLQQQRAEAEAAVARRPSTLKATLKAATAVERAHAHVLAELRLLAALDTPA
jgi:hypothetical protein